MDRPAIRTPAEEGDYYEPTLTTLISTVANAWPHNYLERNRFEGCLPMLTNFGKVLRKIRVEHDITLGDLGDKLGVSAAFISALETGKKAVPASFLNKVVTACGLSKNEELELQRAAAQQAKEVSIGNLTDRSDKARELAVAFARKFETMSEAEVNRVLKSLR